MFCVQRRPSNPPRSNRLAVRLAVSADRCGLMDFAACTCLLAILVSGGGNAPSISGSQGHLTPVGRRCIIRGMRHIKSQTFCRSLRRMFRFGNAEEEQLQIQAIRLYVLYEDMKLEFEGAAAVDLSELEGTNLETRRFYFVRRAFGTLFEISGALQALDKNAVFTKLKAEMSPGNAKTWDQGLKFFRAEHEYLKGFRNDVGGHFLDDAARFGLNNLEDTVECFELYRRGNGADMKLKFAYYFVAQALMRQKGQHISVEDYLTKRAYPFLFEATHHAIHTVQAFAIAHLMRA